MLRATRVESRKEVRGPARARGGAPLVEALEERRLMARSVGIDVSHWQGTINWPQVKAAGKEFAFIKVTQGTSYVDPRSAANVPNARAAGVLVGVYHYADIAGNSPVAEAEHFLNVARNYVRPGYLPPVLDLETGGVNSSAGRAALSQWANDWCATVRNATGVDPIIYCNTNYATYFVNSSVNTHTLWLARYATINPQVDQPPTPSGYPNPYGVWNVPFGSSTPSHNSWTFWQHSNTGSVSGISGNVDLDVFNGTTAGLQAVVIQPAEARVQVGAAAVTDGQAAAIDFGAVTQGQPGPTVTFTVYNDGGVNMTLAAPTVPAGYTITEPLAATLAPGASDTFTVRLNTATAATRSGQISFATNDPNENPFNFPVTGRVNPADTTPPLVTASGFVYETSPHRITMTFNEDVQATLAAPDLLVQKLGEGGGATSLPTLDYSAATRTATFSFSNYPGGQLPDGNYRATIPAGAVADAAGNPMAAFTLDFFVLAGDVNRDRTVNGSDFSLLATNFGKSGQTYADGDVTGDGNVNGSDFSVLAANFGKSLPAVQASANASALPVRVVTFNATVRTSTRRPANGRGRLARVPAIHGGHPV